MVAAFGRAARVGGRARRGDKGVSVLAGCGGGAAVQPDGGGVHGADFGAEEQIGYVRSK